MVENGRPRWERVLEQLGANGPAAGNGDEAYRSLRELLSLATVPDAALAQIALAFEHSDLFSIDRGAGPGARPLASLEDAAAKIDPEFKVALREVPVRSTQLHASSPTWAAGALPERSLGPFAQDDGRLFWFDFFRIEKLVALYAHGNPQPLILFKIDAGFRFVHAALPLAAEAALRYALEPDSVWINARLLAPDAPTGYFAGLTISGGQVTLSAKPQLIDGRLTLPPGTQISLDLLLRAGPASDADFASPYGEDARRMALRLPDRLAFQVREEHGTIHDAGDAAWTLYDQNIAFRWDEQTPVSFDSQLNRLMIPFTADTDTLAPGVNASPFHTLTGEAAIADAFWAIPAGPIDVANPSPAAGDGGIVVRAGPGLTASWTGLNHGPLALRAPSVLADPGRIAITDTTAGNGAARHALRMWQDARNPFGTDVRLQMSEAAAWFFNALASGTELVSTHCAADVRTDRPVTVRGEPVGVRSRDSLLVLGMSKQFRLVYLIDNDLLADGIDSTAKPPEFPKPISLALANALFKVTPPAALALFGRLNEACDTIEGGSLFLTFGLYAYLPTLPDPYAANIGGLRYQFRNSLDTAGAVAIPGGTVWEWLVCRTRWEPKDDATDTVEVSFHFAPLADAQAQPAQPVGATLSIDDLSAGSDGVSPKSFGEKGGLAALTFVRSNPPLPDYGKVWEDATARFTADAFALLDVSTNADLLGISLGFSGGERLTRVTTHRPVPGSAGFPLQIDGMDVTTRSDAARAFMLPQISWEPVLNLAPATLSGDPPGGVNYYPDDGGATRILNNGTDAVKLAPLPLTDFLVENLMKRDSFAAIAFSTLPFGLRSTMLLSREYQFDDQARPGPRVSFNASTFPDELTGGRQLRIDGGAALRDGESAMFMGSTIQINNVLDLTGAPTGAATLGRSVTNIFNNEWMPQGGQIIRQRGVPLERIDWSGYGASAFSNWLNPNAAIAETSQAKFDIWVGRCAHEIIQVRSIICPWGIKVVRTITLFRTPSNYIYRHDSGWRAESDGRFDFRYNAYKDQGDGILKPDPRPSPYDIHPGIVGGLFAVHDIEETRDIQPFAGTVAYAAGEESLDENGLPVTGPSRGIDYELQPVFFNADIEIENPVSGFAEKTHADGIKRKVVPGKRILGFVQIAPKGMPIKAQVLRDLIVRQGGTIGGTIDCVVEIGAANGQQMRLSGFDVANAFGADGSSLAFAVSGRGSVLLPKDGAWSLVQHAFGTGEVSPVPKQLSVPLIRAGRLVASASGGLEPDVAPKDALLRIADPAELLRAPVNGTTNFGFLQSTDTQKALFLTPAFRLGETQLLSKSPPLFADAFRIVNSKAIFPNVGKAIPGDIGDAISLAANAAQFAKVPGLADGTADVFALMQVNDISGVVRKAGYKLLKQLAAPFELPNTEWTLVDLGGTFKIYLEYKADNVSTPSGPMPGVGGLDFGIDSFTDTVADQWKSRMANVSIVVDLGPVKRLMTIKGSWDAKKGAQAAYEGNSDIAGFPSPQIEFSPDLKPVIEILQILQSLQGEDYKDAFARGLKLAMSNKAGSWEYKFEASQEIPVLRFPMPMFLYNDPNAPMKLEAGLKLGAYFDAAFMVPTDPKQLLPTAGAYLGFYGRLSVMCVSLSIATVYAVGQANLDIAADTKSGPSLRMNFGFGAQVVVGLPVVGNVSVLYMVKVEVYTSATEVRVSAGLLFQGHAEILGGLVGVTIMIEAKGSVSRSGDRTDLAAQVTFGLDISIFLVIDISFSTSWEEQRRIA